MGKRDGKTEAPTQKKKQDARKKGTVAKSADLGPWITLLVAHLRRCRRTIGQRQRRSSVGIAQRAARCRGTTRSADRRSTLLGTSLRSGLMATMPFLLVCMLVGVVTHLGQTGLVLSLHPLKPDFKRVNPIQGIKRLFSMRVGVGDRRSRSPRAW